MAKTAAQRRAQNKYQNEKLHPVLIKYTLADYEVVSVAAASAGLPVGSFVRTAVDEKIARDAEDIAICESLISAYNDDPDAGESGAVSLEDFAAQEGVKL